MKWKSTLKSQYILQEQRRKDATKLFYEVKVKLRSSLPILPNDNTLRLLFPYHVQYLRHKVLINYHYYFCIAGFKPLSITT